MADVYSRTITSTDIRHAVASTEDLQGAKASSVKVSATGTATDTVKYITVDGVEKKLAGGSGGSYTAGNGIAISADDVISIDTNITATKAHVTETVTTESTARSIADTSLSNRIDALSARGRYLSLWNSTTGSPQDTPTIPEGAAYPYTYSYKPGDYYIIGTVAASGNKKPAGSSITKASAEASWVIGSADESETVHVNDVYYYSGTGWALQVNSGQQVSFASISGQPSDNTNLNAALNAKQNTLTAGENITIVNNVISATGGGGGGGVTPYEVDCSDLEFEIMGSIAAASIDGSESAEVEAIAAAIYTAIGNKRPILLKNLLIMSTTGAESYQSIVDVLCEPGKGTLKINSGGEIIEMSARAADGLATYVNFESADMFSIDQNMSTATVCVKAEYIQDEETPYHSCMIAVSRINDRKYTLINCGSFEYESSSSALKRVIKVTAEDYPDQFNQLLTAFSGHMPILLKNLPQIAEGEVSGYFFSVECNNFGVSGNTDPCEALASGRGRAVIYYDSESEMTLYRNVDIDINQVTAGTDVQEYDITVTIEADTSMKTVNIDCSSLTPTVSVWIPRNTFVYDITDQNTARRIYDAIQNDAPVRLNMLPVGSKYVIATCDKLTGVASSPLGTVDLEMCGTFDRSGGYDCVGVAYVKADMVEAEEQTTYSASIMVKLQYDGTTRLSVGSSSDFTNERESGNVFLYDITGTTLTNLLSFIKTEFYDSFTLPTFNIHGGLIPLSDIIMQCVQHYHSSSSGIDAYKFTGETLHGNLSAVSEIGCYKIVLYVYVEPSENESNASHASIAAIRLDSI